jgi:hypothetical protein
MGKTALLVVLGLAISVGIITYTINHSTGYLVENVSGFDKHTSARNIAHTGINMMLRVFDRDTSVVGRLKAGQTIWQINTVMAGRCSVSAHLIHPPALDTLNITSKSKYMDSSYTINLRLKSFPKPFPGVNSALGLASAPFNFNMNGTPHIYGENYNMNGSRGNTAYDTNGVSVISKAESTVVANAGGSRITGDPKSVVVNPPDNPISYVPEYIAGADVVFGNGSNNNGNYGSAANPVIGYADGNVKFGGNGTFYGVLIVHGTLDFVGNFDMFGLVIAYGDSNVISVSAASGTPQIYGGVIATGPANSSFTMKGTTDLRYSVEALAMAKGIGKMQAYKVISWYEYDRLY